MIDTCWESILSQLVKGYCSLDYIKETWHWLCLEIFDGFGAHLSNVNALQMRLDRKSSSTKEEEDSSSLNQSYDIFVTNKSDKKKQRETLAVLRKMKRANNFID